MQGYGYFSDLNEILIFYSHGVGTINCICLRLMCMPVWEKQILHMIKE